MKLKSLVYVIAKLRNDLIEKKSFTDVFYDQCVIVYFLHREMVSFWKQL